MNPDAHHLWRAPRWALAVLLATLGMLGPFSIDTYIPAFAGIASSLDATPLEMQQTLSAYLFGFAFMSLFHGALSDSIGRRPVVLWGLAAFTLASMGCALSQSIGQLVFFRAVQGLTTGAGIVVSRAVVRDMFPPAQAQKVMSQITIFFGVAPAIAPMIGGVLFAHLGWHSVFWFLTAVGVALWAANYKLLPETLHLSQRQPLKLSNLLQGYWKLGLDPRFLLLALASGIPFNGMFLYVLSAPVFLGEHLALAPTQFFWFFVLTISGIMGGALVSGRMAGRLAPKQQIKYGFAIMLGIAAHQPAGQCAVCRACGVGHVPGGDICLWLGHDGAGGHAAGARPAPRPARHGVEPAGLHRRQRQRGDGGRDRAAGDAFHRGAGGGVAGHAVGGPAGLALAASPLARDWPRDRASGGVS